MTISTADRKAQEAKHFEAIRNGTFYFGSEQEAAIDALVDEISGLSDEAYEAAGGGVLSLLESVVRREGIRLSDTINPDRVKEITQALGSTGASTAIEFMEAMAEKLSGPYVPYAGENPIHVVLPVGVIPGYEQPKAGPMSLPDLPA